MSNVRSSLCRQSAHSFFFPPHRLRTAPSRLPNTVRFGNRPPLIRMSVPAHKSILVCATLSQCSHTGLSQGRGCTRSSDRWSGPFRCAPMVRSKTRWCTVREVWSHNTYIHACRQGGGDRLRDVSWGTWTVLCSNRSPALQHQFSCDSVPRFLEDFSNQSNTHRRETHLLCYTNT